MMPPCSFVQKLCFGSQMYHNFTSTALCHLTILSKIMVRWCIFSGRNALRKPSPLLNKPQSLKKPNINHQDHIYNATTQVSSPAQLRGQFAILQGQQEHLKMTLQKNPKENTQKKEKKAPQNKTKPNSQTNPLLNNQKVLLPGSSGSCLRASLETAAHHCHARYGTLLLS